MRSRVISAALAALLVLSIAAVASAGGSSTRHSGTGKHEATAKMRVRLAVTKDAKMGYNLRVLTRDFEWAPQHASGKHVRGEGHAHLYVDGVKRTRLYGEWYYLGTLSPGRHSIMVTLNGNDHDDYARHDKVLMASVPVIVPEM